MTIVADPSSPTGCNPQFVIATAYSGFAYYKDVTYSFVNCTVGSVFAVQSQDFGYMGANPKLTLDASCL